MNVIERGERAQKLLDDPLYQESFSLVREAIFAKWEATPLRDKDGAHELKLMLKLLGDLKACLETAVNDGKVETLQSDPMRKRLYGT